MRYLSVCSGIEAATVAWHPLGWTPAAFSEIEPFPRAVLAHRFPGVPIHGDFTTIDGNEYGAIDLLVGGTPCQSFSVAGLRGGLDDDRGNLALEFLRLAQRTRPRWLVWENVPGVLSSNGGRDFGSILGGLVELGYGFAYRVLDAQYFGVAQRRRRVFVVGCLGDWRRAAAVLFERDSLSRNPAPRREAGQRVANALTERADRGGTNSEGQRLTASVGDSLKADFNCDKSMIQAFGGNNRSGSVNVATARNACASGSGRLDFETETFIVQPTHSLRGEGFDASEDGTGRGIPLVPVAFHPTQDPICSTDGTTHAMGTGSKGGQASVAVAFYANQGSHGNGNNEEISVTLKAHPKTSNLAAVAQSMAVRRLTPRECERLQGFPDDWTLVPYRGREAADGPRYKAIGNSMAVPVMRWIGQRIQMVLERD